MSIGNFCILKKNHPGDVHTSGSFPCETGNRFKFVDAETAALYPACGNDGVMSEQEHADALASMESGRVFNLVTNPPKR